MTGAIKNRPLLAFVILAYIWSWLFWIPGVLIYYQTGQEITTGLLALTIVGALGPSIAALIVTAVLEGRSGVGRLLRKFLIWKVGVHWYVIALALPSLLLAIALLLNGITPVNDNLGAWLINIPVAILSALPFGPLLEELGWRGFGLPRLQARYSPIVSSVILGTVWAFWHTPTFWVPGVALSQSEELSLYAVGIYWLRLVAFSLLITWVFNATRGSVLLASLFHAGGNAAGGLMASLFGLTTLGLIGQLPLTLMLWIAVLVVVFVLRGLRRTPETITEPS